MGILQVEVGKLNSFFCPLHSEALLHIEGPDSLTFLQGQTTCDTRRIDATQAALGAYCTPQGRVVCDFLLAELGSEHYALRMRRDLRAHAAEVFGKYIVFSKADLDAQREDWLILGLWGPSVGDDLAAILPQTPSGALACSAGDDFVLVQLDDKGDRFECYLPAESPHLDALQTRFQAGTEDHWQALEISTGIARIDAATTESEVPQVLNYDLTGHISFDKGCYTGQEVVARLHYRGKSKRRTHLAELQELAPAGNAIFADGNGQSIGNVINAAGGDKPLALITLAESALGQSLHVGEPDGPTLKLGELPYALPE